MHPEENWLVNWQQKKAEHENFMRMIRANTPNVELSGSQNDKLKTEKNSMDNHEEEKEPLIAQSRAGEAGAYLSVGLGDELSPKVQNIKNMFEEWLPRQMGGHVKKYFANFHHDDGYADQIINAMWIGFCAGYVIRG